MCHALYVIEQQVILRVWYIFCSGLTPSAAPHWNGCNIGVSHSPPSRLQNGGIAYPTVAIGYVSHGHANHSSACHPHRGVPQSYDSQAINLSSSSGMMSFCDKNAIAFTYSSILTRLILSSSKLILMISNAFPK